MKHTHTLPPLLLIELLLTLSSLPTVQAATNCAAVTEIPPAQCDTLLALYNSTGGANWTNKMGWNETNTPCSWNGIYCGGGNNVTVINLGSNNLKGSLPNLSALTGLWHLELSVNQLTGTIPDLSKLTSLRELHLGGNQLTGTIPDLSKLTSLRVLILWGNQLTGTIPDLSQLTSLQTLYLQSNQLTGAIPDLSKLTSLQFLYLSKNQLTGTIPDLSKLTRLLYIVLNNNKLTGAIPNLTKLTSLLRLWLNDNQLSGPIPSLNTLPLEDTLGKALDRNKEMIWGLNLSNNSLLCRDPNANYGTQTYKISSLVICSTVPLTITKTGTGTGIVITTSNATINCGTTCQANLALNGTVTLTATPATDSTFASWSGDCTGTTAKATVTMGTAKSCTATFNQIPGLSPARRALVQAKSKLPILKSIAALLVKVTSPLMALSP